MNEMNKIGYYAIIPSTVLFNKRLKSNEKLLYAVITSLANKEGYCFASNRYFAEMFNVAIPTISSWISNLQKCGCIRVEINKSEKNEFISRHIFIEDKPYSQKNEYPSLESNEYSYSEFDEKGINQNVNYNIINNNMVDRFYLYIINEDEKIPEEFAKVEKVKIIELLYKYEMIYNNEMLQYMQKQNLQKIKEITYAIALIVKDNLQQFAYKITRDKLIQLYNECKTRELDYKGTDKEIEGFVNYYYKSIKNEMVKDSNQSFFMPENEKENNIITSGDEEGVEV